MKTITRKYSWFNSIRIPFECSPLPTCIRIIVMLIAHLSPVIQIFATAMFVDRALALLKGKTEWAELILPILLLGGIIIYDRLSYVITNICKQVINNDLRSKYVVELTKKSAMLHYSAIENHETWDVIKRVKKKPDETIQRGLDSILNLLGIALQLISFLAILFFQVWWAVILVIFIAVPSIIIGMKGGEKQYEAQRKVSKYERYYEYMEEVMIGRESVDERSLFSYSKFIQTKWREFYMKARRAELTITAKWLFRMKAISSVMVIVTFAIALILLNPLSKGYLTVGLYISLVQSANSLVSLMSWDLSDNINAFAKHKEYLKDIDTFFGLPEIPDALDLPVKNTFTLNEIEFKDVTFYYPGTKKEVLHHFNLRLTEGRHYAIVGGNGAGKTTIIKLLTGLYTEFSGDILINGISIQKYSIPELKSLMSVLFQDFARYEVTLHDNIALGDILNLGRIEQEREITSAIEQLGLIECVSSLPDGVNTKLGKLSEDGQDLSGGQWQRVALARIVLSSAPLLILDEPTAALDPMSESKLYEEFAEISKGRTTLLISHRLGSTKLADEILVLEEGRIIQQGTHENLMTQPGLYKEMYESQRSWYQ